MVRIARFSAIALLVGLSLGTAIPAYATSDLASDAINEEQIPGSIQNNPMIDDFELSPFSSSTPKSTGLRIYGWPQIDNVHAPRNQYVSVHGWWTTQRNDLKRTKARVTSILMVKRWYGYSHIGNSSTSSASRLIYPNQKSKRSNARANCKDARKNTFWAMTILTGSGVIKKGTKSNAPVVLRCTPR